ncbi:hypothetical protein LX36DRAFT_686373 [Colletotrichum falcatum]|nr:hypothetical protein LX36DRAFT_686373 [Colletotrichum falcatum]
MKTLKRLQQDLIESLQKLYATGVYSDLIISSSAKSFSVHRAIICPRCEFFAAACRNPFEEATDGVISLPDDDPVAVEMMVQYFYNLGYCKPTPESNSDRSHADLCQTTQEHSDSGDISDILLHAKVYAIAEKYAIGGLKALARIKFQTTASKCWDTDDFLDAISEAYTSTLDSDRGLRDIVLKVFAEHEQLLDWNEIKELLRRLGSLAYDLLMHYHHKDKPDLGW